MTATQTDSKEFSGKRALVTGGTKGIGEAIVRRLRLAGATVIITARSKPDELQSPELFIQSDISTPDGVDKVVKERSEERRVGKESRAEEWPDERKKKSKE